MTPGVPAAPAVAPNDPLVLLVLTQQWRQEWRKMWRNHCEETNTERDPHRHTVTSLEHFCAEAANKFAKEPWFLDATLQLGGGTRFSRALQHFSVFHRGEGALEEIKIANRVAKDLMRVNSDLNSMWLKCVEEAQMEVEAEMASQEPLMEEGSPLPVEETREPIAPSSHLPPDVMNFPPLPQIPEPPVDIDVPMPPLPPMDFTGMPLPPPIPPGMPLPPLPPAGMLGLPGLPGVPPLPLPSQLVTPLPGMPTFDVPVLPGVER